MDDRYYSELAQAFVRGRLSQPDATIEDGVRAGLRLHKFKHDTDLARVQRVLGILRGLAPQDLLDTGSGRGTFLWPLLAAFPALPVTSIDVSAQRAGDVHAVRKGGITRLHASQMDAQRMAFADRSRSGSRRSPLCHTQRAIRSGRQSGAHSSVHSGSTTTNGR
jgi:hypothetical protein